MNSRLVKTVADSRLYEIQYVVHSNRQNPAEDVFACYQLSATDGMPIGQLVWIRRDELTSADYQRIDTATLPTEQKGA